MVKTVKRRMSDPQIVLQLWEAITCIRQSKQVANCDRIYRFMERSYEVPTKEVQKQMAYTTKENLLVKEISKTKKGERAGETQDGYWCAEERTEESKEPHNWFCFECHKGEDVRHSEEPHDWYCFECHKGGDVLCCGTCHRVYHPECVGVDDPEKILSLWFCPICESVKKKSLHMSKWDLNKILLHVLSRMKEKSRELTKKLNLNELPNYYNLVYQHMDLSTMMDKLSEKRYRSLEEFQGDAKMLVHIAHVYHGPSSERAELCEQTLQDCIYDLYEIRLCKDCYIMSNDRTQKDWFCKPCNPPHELVWAQMTGFGYWPAKVLQKTDTRVDVRFFGSRHERAWIDLIHVRDISTDRKKLKLKQSMGWRSAVKEMESYTATLADAQEKAPVKVKDRTSSGRKRKHKKIEDGDGEEDDSSIVEDEDEEEEDAICEARHAIKTSSTTDAGQDHSVSTSQTSPPDPDSPVSKKSKMDEGSSSSSSTSRGVKAAVKTKSDVESDPDPEPMDAVPDVDKQETKEEVLEEVDSPDDTPPPPLTEEGGSCKQEVVTKTTATAALKARLEAEYKKKTSKAVKEALEKAKQEWQAEKEKLLREAKERLHTEVQKVKTDTENKYKKELNEQIQKLSDEISQTKKKQWCINCEKEAMYHCCWNTSYCSISCQQVHWHQEHKRLCRRKR